jgi:hypothetical protein
MEILLIHPTLTRLQLPTMDHLLMDPRVPAVITDQTNPAERKVTKEESLHTTAKKPNTPQAKNLHRKSFTKLITLPQENHSHG